MKAVGLQSLLATALRATLREGYGAAALRQDVLAGLVVAMVALPLAMALGVGVGVAPQYGLYTAIVAGFIVAALGGSRTQVSGPTAAFIVILASVQAKHGFGGLLMAGMLAGVVLMGMGALRLGRFITFVPHPVTTGFTAGIATVIAVLQFKDLLGLTPASNPDVFLKRVVALFDARHTFTPSELSIGIFTFLVLRYAPKITTKLPSPLLALPLAAVVAAVAHYFWPSFSVATIASRFHSEHASGIPQLPPLPMLPWLQLGPGGVPFSMTFDGLRDISSSAFAIAALAAMESLLSATIADGLTRTKHDPNGELMALGIANVITPFFGGIAATGAIARTATNIRSGARSPVAAMVHSLALLIAVLTIAPLLGYLPMAALAALLLIVAINMSEARHFVHTLRVAPKSDVVVLLTCYILTVGIDMVVGVSVGMVLAAFLFMRRMAEVTQADLSDGSQPAVETPVPPGVAIYTISGPLFFGAAQRAIEVLSVIGSKTKVVILDLAEMGAIDLTGLVALESALTNLRSRGCRVFFAGVRSQPLSVLMRAGILARLDVQVAGKLDDAVRRATETIATLDPLPAQN